MNTLLTLDITVFDKPGSVQGAGTYKALDKCNFEYQIVDLREDADSRDFTMSLGYLQAPVVYCEWKVNGTVVSPPVHWSGFRPERIKRLRTEYVEMTSRLIHLLNENFQAALHALIA